MSIVENILFQRERFTAKLQKANIFDNFFMRVVLKNKEVCRYVLRKLLTAKLSAKATNLLSVSLNKP